MLLPKMDSSYESCKGKAFKGRNCARKMATQFRYMEADLYNLQLGSPQLGFLQDGSPQDGSPQVSSPQVGSLQLGFLQVGYPQDGSR
jgi:hypothetical protein